MDFHILRKKNPEKIVMICSSDTAIYNFLDFIEQSDFNAADFEMRETKLHEVLLISTATGFEFSDVMLLQIFGPESDWSDWSDLPDIPLNEYEKIYLEQDSINQEMINSDSGDIF